MRGYFIIALLALGGSACVVPGAWREDNFLYRSDLSPNGFDDEWFGNGIWDPAAPVATGTEVRITAWDQGWDESIDLPTDAMPSIEGEAVQLTGASPGRATLRMASSGSATMQWTLGSRQDVFPLEVRDIAAAQVVGPSSTEYGPLGESEILLSGTFPDPDELGDSSWVLADETIALDIFLYDDNGSALGFNGDQIRATGPGLVATAEGRVFVRPTASGVVETWYVDEPLPDWPIEVATLADIASVEIIAVAYELSAFGPCPLVGAGAMIRHADGRRMQNVPTWWTTPPQAEGGTLHHIGQSTVFSWVLPLGRTVTLGVEVAGIDHSIELTWPEDAPPFPGCSPESP